MTLLPALSVALLLLAHSYSLNAMATSSTLASSPSSSSDCPSCAMARLRRSGAEALMQEEEAQQDVVEAVKRHILSMLHLQDRPNITHPVPRAALLNAIRKVHVGRVAKDGSVLIDDEPHGRLEAENSEQTEIITFAEAGETPGLINFLISKEGYEMSVVEQANVWIFLRLPKGNRTRTTVPIRLFLQQPDSGEKLVAEKSVDTRRSGWHTFPIASSMQSLLEQGISALNLRVSCPTCADARATPILVTPGGGGEREQSHRPFLMAVVRQMDESGTKRRRKRGLECDGKVRVCCKRQFYVNFKDIGWSDWIIAPTGYHANYCEGECPSHVASITGSSLSFHSTVINHYRMRGYSPFTSIRSCCVPTRLRAMSMLYYNEEQKIVKKDIQNMIVEECGCS